MEPRFIVGIDLGTTHTVVAYGRVDSSAPPAIFEIDQLVAPGEIEARPLLHSLRYHPAPGELGNHRRNSIEGPAYWTIDLAVFARFYTWHAFAVFVLFAAAYEGASATTLRGRANSSSGAPR